jgi:hypothetical protein
MCHAEFISASPGKGLMIQEILKQVHEDVMYKIRHADFFRHKTEQSCRVNYQHDPLKG